jgi:Glyoxalase-like domain
MSIRWQSVCIDAVDPGPVAAFWEAALGWRRSRSEPDEIVLEPPTGNPEDSVSPDLVVGGVPEPKSIKNRLHVDLRPDDRAAEVARLEGLGATRVFVGQGEVTRVVMADPGDNEFCVLRTLAPDQP